MHLSTKATPGPTQRRRPRHSICTWKWSNGPRRKKALCHCPSAGWWSAATRGRHVFAGWPRDDERLAETLAGLHFVAFAILMLKRFVELIV